MKLEPFQLERFLAEYREPAAHSLASSVITQFHYNELISEADLDMRVRIGPMNGPEALREEISNLYSSVTKDGILVTHGAAEANFLFLNYMLDHRDECIIVVPNYMQVFGVAKATGAKVTLSTLLEQDGYRLNTEELKELVNKRTKLVLVTNPNNPTGVRHTRQEVQAVCDIASEVDAYVLADEVLRGTEMDGMPTSSPVDLYERGIATRSLSKLGLSGLRVGWIATRDAEIARGCWSYKDYTTLGNSYFNQHIALTVLTRLPEIINRDRRLLKENLAVFWRWLDGNRSYLNCVKPQAGATVFPRYVFDMDSVQFCKTVLAESKVLLAPGDYFNGPGRFRALFAGHATETLQHILDRLSRAFTRMASLTN
jgi:aspartate/methionine/tyrosine aminotransferase